jgi:hypothetical protein
MKFRYFIYVFVLLSFGFAWQQSAYYSALSKELEILQQESAQHVYLIKRAMYDEEAILQQYQEAEKQHQQLLELLPAELQEGVVEQQLNALAGKHQIKVLAIKSSVNSKPLYREASINTTLEATASQVKQFIQELQAAPRIINVAPPVSLGKTNVKLSISIYAQNPTAPEEFELHHCIEMPTGILLPPLREWLASRYADYSRNCSFITNYGELYRKQQHLHTLQQGNSRLQGLIEQLQQGHEKSS